MTEQNPRPPAPPAAAGSRYLLLVGGLLVLIIALLAVLWVRERQQRVAAQRDLQQARAALQRIGGQDRAGSLGEALLKGKLLARRAGGQSGMQPVDRANLPAEQARLDGQPVTVLRLGAAGGQRLGLAPGDVIVVSEAPPEAEPGAPAPPAANGAGD